MEWDLYLDESGEFKDPGKPTVVGGVLIPHENNMTMKVFLAWREELKLKVAKSGIFSVMDLMRGDEWHELYVKGGKKGTLSGKNKERFEELSAQKHYVFDHCSENKGISERSVVQPMVLKGFMEKLKAIGGRPVLFMNPDGVYHVDSNTTFMTVFANGIVRLYNSLRENHPEGVVLYVHAAARENITLNKESEKAMVSPLRGDGPILEKGLYLNQIRNYVFLNGGYDLLELNAFKSTIDSFEILYDMMLGGKQVPNPATVVCDYVSNSALNIARFPVYKEILDNADLISYDVFNEPFIFSDTLREHIIQRHDWLAYLKILISQKFPEEKTEDCFDRINGDYGYNQNKCVDGLVDFLYPLVEDRQDMPELVERILMILEKCKPINDDAYNLLKANLLIYLIALYTHLGNEKKMHEAEKDFVGCLSNIREYIQRDELLILFCNRKIVIGTDAFRYDDAELWFSIIRDHIVQVMQNSDSMMEDFAALINKDEKLEKARSVQYGKAIGSYLQLLTKIIRVSSKEEKERQKGKAKEVIGEALNHFMLPRDISRCHQNICDLEVELGNYEEALDHLYRAVAKNSDEGDEIDFGKKAAEILKVTGNYGEKDKGLFPYLHYVYLMHRCFRLCDEHADILFNRMAKVLPGRDKISHLMTGPHPQAVIAWHLGASIAMNGKSPKLAGEILETAIQILSGAGSEIFSTIAMAVRAEQIALGLEGRLDEEEKIWIRIAEQFIKVSYPAYAERTVNNPFREIAETKEEEREPNPWWFRRFADIVAF